jgi:hypothetical protein
LHTPVSPTGKGSSAAMNPSPKRKAETMSEAKLTKAELRQFTGSEQWYRHGLVRSVLFTDGAKYVADQGGAYWLLDEIALASAATAGSPPRNFRCGNWRSSRTGPQP